MSAPPAPSAPDPGREPPLLLRVDGPTLVACLDALLAVPTPVMSVEALLVRSVGQGGDYAWLGFVTHHPDRGWERNGLAVEAPGLGAGRRIVLDLRGLAAAAASVVGSSPAGPVVVEWRGDALVVGGRSVPAEAATVPIVPEVPAVRDSVYLGGSYFGDVVVESEQGRIRIPGALVAHLLQRGAVVAELGVLEGDVYVVAQSERRGEASTDPVIVAPVDLLMWSEESAQPAFRERRRQGGGEVEQLLAALDPATPSPTLLELLDTGVAYVRRRAAAHPALPAEVTDELARTGTRPMRMAVAANSGLSAAAIDTLVTDPDADVRVEIGRNPALDPTTVTRLAGDEDAEVRTAAALHPALPADQRVRMADDPAPSVRAAVASDAATPVEVVARLAHDDDPGVRRGAAVNPVCPHELLEALSQVMPDAVLANPSAPEKLLVDGSRAVDGGLRAVVAANPSTPAKVLTALARDPDARVLRGVATNPQAPAPARRRAEKRMMTDEGGVPAPESVAW